MDIADELNAAELAGLRSASPTTFQNEVFEQWNSPSTAQPNYGAYPESYQPANQQENYAGNTAMSVLPQLMIDGIEGAMNRSNFQNPIGRGEPNYGYMEPGIQSPGSPMGYRGFEDQGPRMQAPNNYGGFEQREAPNMREPIGIANRPMMNQPAWNDRGRR